MSSGPVVVAVGDAGHGPALDWAAAEAAAQGSRLHVVHADRFRWAADPSGLVPVADLTSFQGSSRHLVRAAVARAHAVASDIEVTSETVLGPAVPVVVAQARGARLLVLGRRTGSFRTGLRGLLAPSVCRGIARRASCPVAAVGPLHRSGEVCSAPRVVAGVEASAPCEPVLDVAFRAASQRGLPLTVVHAWSPDLPADHEGVCGSPAAVEERARRILENALAPLRSRFADVPVELRLRSGDAAGALVQESSGAALVVLGAGTRRRATAALFRSVGSHVAEHARCPVVLVGTGVAAPRRGAPEPRRPLRRNPTEVDPERRPTTSWG